MNLKKDKVFGVLIEFFSSKEGIIALIAFAIGNLFAIFPVLYLVVIIVLGLYYLVRYWRR